jgi:hypothetical protein
VKNGDDIADSSSVTGSGLDTRTWRGERSVLKGTHKRAFENMQEEENWNSDAES